MLNGNYIFAHARLSQMPVFHPLPVKDIRKETEECVSIQFDVPDNLKDVYSFTQGQYLTLKLIVGGEELRRSYSICSDPYHEKTLKVAAKKIFSYPPQCRKQKKLCLICGWKWHHPDDVHIEECSACGAGQ